MTTKARGFNRCSNPFGLEKHTKRKGLRHPSQEFIAHNPSLCKKDLLCAACRKQMGIVVKQNIPLPTVEKLAPVQSEQSLPDLSQNSNQKLRTKRSVLNEALALMERSPVAKKKLRSSDVKQVEAKEAPVATMTTSKQSLRLPNKPSASQDSGWDIPKMIDELKKKFHSHETDRNGKIQILTLLPESWSVTTVAREMNTTLFMARTAKALYRDKGILSIPNDRLGETLPIELKSRIIDFYQDDEVSFELPGVKNYIGIRDENGTKIHQQKRLILCNLKELHQSFGEKNPELEVGFSIFASLRPEHCVLARYGGTHTDRICVMHQNMKLMIQGCNLSSLTKDCEPHLTGYQDCIKFLMCKDSRRGCHLRVCAECPTNELLKEILIRAMESNDVEHVTYKQWIPKPRTTLVTQTVCATEFAAELYDQVKTLLEHSFVAKQQSVFIKSTKDSLKIGECLVTCDFAENYEFPISDTANGLHWNNNQATLYPVVIYFKDGDNQIAQKKLIIISDCLEHDPTAVYMFSRVINNFIRSFITNLSKVFYSSISDTQRFKNEKNFTNVYCHQQDFAVPAEWHFFATAHGKRPCDRIAGTVRRQAAKYSLQLLPDQQITTARGLFDWANLPGNLPDIAARYVERSEYAVAMDILRERFAKAKPIPNTEKLHCIIPTTCGNVYTKLYSADTEYEMYPMFVLQ